jgi:hypothetical protein
MSRALRELSRYIAIWCYLRVILWACYNAICSIDLIKINRMKKYSLLRIINDIKAVVRETCLQ